VTGFQGVQILTSESEYASMMPRQEETSSDKAEKIREKALSANEDTEKNTDPAALRGISTSFKRTHEIRKLAKDSILTGLQRDHFYSKQKKKTEYTTGDTKKSKYPSKHLRNHCG
jgi:hypothetical protein